MGVGNKVGCRGIKKGVGLGLKGYCGRVGERSWRLGGRRSVIGRCVGEGRVEGECGEIRVGGGK